MAQVNVNIAGRTYRMACGDGEEEHLEGLARTLDARIGAMRKQFGEIGDGRITVMAAITLADDLSDAKKRIATLEGELAANVGERRSEDARLHAMGGRVAAAIDDVVAAIDAVTVELADGADPQE